MTCIYDGQSIGSGTISWLMSKNDVIYDGQSIGSGIKVGNVKNGYCV